MPLPLNMHGLDISRTDDRFQVLDIEDDAEFDCNNEDTQSVYNSRILSNDEEVTEEDCSDTNKDPTLCNEELQILSFNEDCIWVPIQQRCAISRALRRAFAL